ncbi:acetyl-lysine deacetylase [Leptolinea sp. HRD-7]|nr:acetyl-lysine deacetylase [Leptolinea sp. HRD-7]
MDSVSLLTGLLQHFSPTGQESGAVTFLVNAMQQLGFQAHVDPIGNAVGTIGTGSQEIVLLGHIDTVSGEIRIRQENDSLYGRGAVDAKGPLASFVAAAAQAQISPDWRITVIGAVGEEGDSRGARYLCENYPSPVMTVIGEPSGWNAITLGYKGSIWARVSVHQPASHTASGATSACDQAVMFWNQLTNEIAAINEGKSRLFDRLSPSIRTMDFKSDGFTDHAILNLNVRLPQGIDLQTMQALMDVCKEKTGVSPEIEIPDYMPAYLGDKNTPLVRAFLAGIRAAGGTPGFKLKTGTADLNLVAPAWNCPAIAYGAGDSTLDHTANEHIEIPEYLLGIQVLKAALEKIQGIAARSVEVSPETEQTIAIAKKCAKDKPDKFW